MDSIYYKLIALVLLFPWALFGLTLVGYLRARWSGRGRSG